MLIIFTVTNKVTAQVYVGSTRNDLESQWEKMVSAAEQNMDYPLYREIRTQGADNFVVEEWDCTDDRSELAILEQEALETFGARSLKGYKTSTVKIQPKKKARQRKSSIEKELATLFAELSDNDPSEDMAAASYTSQDDKKTDTTNSKKEANQSSLKPAVSTAIKSLFSQMGETANELQQSTEQENTGEKEQPVSGSQANAVVQMSDINLGDDITAQLAAIQAAADAAIAGDTSSAAELNFIREEPKQKQPESVQQQAKVPQPEKIITLDPKEQRIRDAIERSRKARASKTTDIQMKEKQQLAALLAELEARVSTLQNISLAAAA
ncbi:GIY-YIG nuclease family protein [Endozoicomonas sp. Mp262]|uniref:GIY-YIG nuclease family protein n=1 Tax=Endozoicomonas sp. Mp262 TaxID=2919499 RepID=UPI0021E041C0